MSSFGGVDFEVSTEGWQETAQSQVSVRGYPGGDNIAISLGGQREVRRTMTLHFTDRGGYVNLVLRRGQQDTLAVDSWDSVGAVLISVTGEALEADGGVRCKAEFVLT